MARDHHQKTRGKNHLLRKKAFSKGCDRILIITEGEKTEPHYFDEIRKYYRLSTASIEIMQSKYGTTPQQVVNFAVDRCKEAKEYEAVYCVFDRDDHPNFLNALFSANSHDRKYKNDNNELINFYAVQSIPCFELWLLLHFVSVRSYIHRDEVVRQLKKDSHIPNYTKGGNGYFNITKDRLEVAYKNADLLAANDPLETEKNTENPYTSVGKLVKILTSLNAHLQT